MTGRQHFFREALFLFIVVICTVAILDVHGCSSEEPESVSPVQEEPYRYSGFVLTQLGNEIFRCENGISSGKIFLYMNEVLLPAEFMFLDSDGAYAGEPDSTTVVLLNPESEDRVEIQPSSLPNDLYGWGVKFSAKKIGIARMHVTFIPEGICKETIIELQVAG